MTGLDAKPGPDAVTGVVVHSAMERTGEFECSSPLVNQLFQNIIWGQKGNYLEVPTDCPQRDERAGWSGDAQFFVRHGGLQLRHRELLLPLAHDPRASIRSCRTGASPTSRRRLARLWTATGWRRRDAALHARALSRLRRHSDHRAQFRAMSRYMDWLEAKPAAGGRGQAARARRPPQPRRRRERRR